MFLNPPPFSRLEGVEIKAAHIYELELESRSEAEIFFVPIKPGNYAYSCEGLEDRGVAGTFIVR